MTTALFRQEAVEAASAAWLGSIRIGRNPSFTIVTVGAAICAISLVAFAVWGEVTRKSRLPGVLAPIQGTLNISAQAAGAVSEIRVVEGQSVNRGDVLLVLSTDRTTATGEAGALVAQSVAARRAALQSERSTREAQASQSHLALADRLRSIETELRQSESEVKFMSSRIALAQKSADRYLQLSRDGFVSEVMAQQKQEELIELQMRLQVAERNQTALRRDAQSIRAQQVATDTQLQADLAQLDQSLLGLQQEGVENDARRQILVTSPHTGIVSTLTVKSGQSAQLGQTLATVIPGDAKQAPRLEAQIFAPSRTVGFVQPGQDVWLRYAAYPYQKFGMHRGVITDVSRTPLDPEDLPRGQASALLAAAQTNEAMYRITVKLDNQNVDAYGKPQPLKPGMTFDADVVQDKRSIWEWLLEPLFAVSTRP